MKRCRYGLYICNSGSYIICAECDYGADRDSNFTKNEDEADRTCGGSGVPPSEGGHTDDGRSHDTGSDCHYIPSLCERLSEDHSDSVCNTWIWTDRFSG